MRSAKYARDAPRLLPFYESRGLRCHFLPVVYAGHQVAMYVGVKEKRLGDGFFFLKKIKHDYYQIVGVLQPALTYSNVSQTAFDGTKLQKKYAICNTPLPPPLTPLQISALYHIKDQTTVAKIASGAPERSPPLIFFICHAADFRNI